MVTKLNEKDIHILNWALLSYRGQKPEEVINEIYDKLTKIENGN